MPSIRESSAWVKIQPDLTGFVQKAKTGIEAGLKKVDPEVKVGADIRPAAASIGKLQVQGDKFAKSMKNVPVTVDPARAASSIQGLQVRTDGLVKTLAHMDA